MSFVAADPCLFTIGVYIGCVKTVARIVALLVLSWMVVACGFDLEDDHLVINDLPALGDSDAWFVLLDTPAEPIDCVILSGCNAGTVVRGTRYGITGDVEEAKLAALDDIMSVWEPTGEVDPLLDGPMFFRFPDDVDTSTDAAFLRLDFVEEWGIGNGDPVEDVLSVTISTHELSG